MKTLFEITLSQVRLSEVPCYLSNIFDHPILQERRARQDQVNTACINSLKLIKSELYKMELGLAWCRDMDILHLSKSLYKYDDNGYLLYNESKESLEKAFNEHHAKNQQRIEWELAETKITMLLYGYVESDIDIELDNDPYQEFYPDIRLQVRKPKKQQR